MTSRSRDAPAALRTGDALLQEFGRQQKSQRIKGSFRKYSMHIGLSAKITNTMARQAEGEHVAHHADRRANGGVVLRQ